MICQINKKYHRNANKSRVSGRQLPPAVFWGQKNTTNDPLSIIHYLLCEIYALYVKLSHLCENTWALGCVFT